MWCAQIPTAFALHAVGGGFLVGVTTGAVPWKGWHGAANMGKDLLQKELVLAVMGRQCPENRAQLGLGQVDCTNAVQVPAMPGCSSGSPQTSPHVSSKLKSWP